MSYNLRIGPYTYEVLIQRPFGGHKFDSSCWGLTSPNEKRVYINDETDDGQRRETLLHEIIHIVSSADRLSLKEDTIGRLSTWLMAALWNNGLWLDPNWEDMAAGIKKEEPCQS